MTDDILFTEEVGHEGSLGIITLNRTKALNALNHEMISSLSDQLTKWALDNNIKGVFIQAAEGKAFCAGGDIRLTYERIKSKDPANLAFFREEYHLNRLIFHYPKPYIAYLDGMTMGGGVGISVHGSHRIATERLVFAMPETAIGFFPDVGGSYFLPRIKHHLGIYLGLTGARIDHQDCLYLGIATHASASADKNKLLSELLNSPFGPDAKTQVSEILTNYQNKGDNSSLKANVNVLEVCFTETSVEAIMQKLQEDTSPICQDTRRTLLQKSPTSLKTSLAAMLKGKNLSFDECMKQEFRLVNRFLTGHDFQEGIRAVIIDKDQSPKWQPSDLSAVAASDVEDYFAPLIEELF